MKQITLFQLKFQTVVTFFGRCAPILNGSKRQLFYSITVIGNGMWKPDKERSWLIEESGNPMLM